MITYFSVFSFIISFCSLFGIGLCIDVMTLHLTAKSVNAAWVLADSNKQACSYTYDGATARVKKSDLKVEVQNGQKEWNYIFRMQEQNIAKWNLKHFKNKVFIRRNVSEKCYYCINMQLCKSHNSRKE